MPLGPQRTQIAASSGFSGTRFLGGGGGGSGVLSRWPVCENKLLGLREYIVQNFTGGGLPDSSTCAD